MCKKVRTAALIGSKRLDKIKYPLEKVGISCRVIKNPFKKCDADVVITDTPGASIITGWILKKKCNSKLVLRLRGNYWQEIKSECRLPKIRRIIANGILFKLCDKCIPVCYYLKKELYRNIITNVDVVPTYINLERFKVQTRNTNKFNSRFNIISITNFNYLEKISPLIDYSETINEFLKKVNGKWLVAGKGKYLNTFQERTKNLENVIYCGYVYTPDFLKRGKIMIHFSNFESLPTAVLEGMAAGLPVLVNDYKPLKEIEHTILIKNKKDLINWLERLYSNPNLRKKISIKGRKYIEKKYNIHKISQKFFLALFPNDEQDLIH